MKALVGKSNFKKLVAIVILAFSLPTISLAQESEGGAHGGGTFMKPIETCADAIEYVAMMARLHGHADVRIKQAVGQAIAQQNNKNLDEEYGRLEKAAEQVREAIVLAKKICK